MAVPAPKATRGFHDFMKAYARLLTTARLVRTNIRWATFQLTGRR